MLSSCGEDSLKTVVDKKLPEFKPVLVFNSILTTDTIAKASLSKNRFVLEEERYNKYEPGKDSELINDAKISLFEDSKLLGQYREEKKLYSSKYYSPEKGENYSFKLNPKAGSVYKIKAEKKGFATIESTFKMPELKADFNIKDIKVSEDKEPNAKRIRLTYAITDKPGRDFYKLTLLQKIVKENGESYYSKIYYDENKKVDDDFFGSEEDNDNSLFSDELFSEKTLEKTISFIRYNSRTNKSFELIVELKSFSEGYFKYFKSLNKANNANGNPLSQPVQVYSNIENGLGVFGGFVTKKKKFMINL